MPRAKNCPQIRFTAASAKYGCDVIQRASSLRGLPSGAMARAELSSRAGFTGAFVRGCSNSMLPPTSLELRSMFVGMINDHRTDFKQA